VGGHCNSSRKVRPRWEASYKQHICRPDPQLAVIVVGGERESHGLQPSPKSESTPCTPHLAAQLPDANRLPVGIPVVSPQSVFRGACRARKCKHISVPTVQHRGTLRQTPLMHKRSPPATAFPDPGKFVCDRDEAGTIPRAPNVPFVQPTGMFPSFSNIRCATHVAMSAWANGCSGRLVAGLRKRTVYPLRRHASTAA
jgi:hypothetical protein